MSYNKIKVAYKCMQLRRMCQGEPMMRAVQQKKDRENLEDMFAMYDIIAKRKKKKQQA